MARLRRLASKLGGYYLIEAKNLDEATSICGAPYPGPNWASIEVRPILAAPDLRKQPQRAWFGYDRTHSRPDR